MDSENALNIVFAGTPEFAVPPLALMIESGFKPVAVMTQPDRPSGRGRQIAQSAVKELALAHDIPVLQPASLGSQSSAENLGELNADLMVVVAYGLILPEALLRTPRLGCWNIHASLLPRWRGAAPIQRAIEAGDRETGVCIMQMEAGLDTGPVLYREIVPIGARETGGSLHDRLAETGAKALLHCLRLLVGGNLPDPRPQDDSKATYARKLEKAEARIDWSRPAVEIERKIRAFDPWPVCWTWVGEERTRIWKVEVTGQRCIARPGDILVSGNDGIDVATGDGVLRLLELQRPGGRRISANDYLNACTRLPRQLGRGDGTGD